MVVRLAYPLGSSKIKVIVIQTKSARTNPLSLLNKCFQIHCVLFENKNKLCLQINQFQGYRYIKITTALSTANKINFIIKLPIKTCAGLKIIKL